MLDLERDEQILEILQKRKACTVYELSQKLFVSESTVRRDLTRMEQKGLVFAKNGEMTLMPLESGLMKTAIMIV